MAGLGITAAMATGAAGVGVSVDTYQRLTLQLIDDVTTLSDTINDLQDQVDSLAKVVLQNRRGLDLLTAEQGGDLFSFTGTMLLLCQQIRHSARQGQETPRRSSSTQKTTS